MADYIPALASVSGDKLGIAISTVDGQHFAAGDAHERFHPVNLQGIEPVAMNHYQEEEIWQRVGKILPASLNSLLQLEIEQGKPRNPFINAGHWWSATCCRAGSAPRVSGCWRLSAV